MTTGPLHWRETNTLCQQHPKLEALRLAAVEADADYAAAYYARKAARDAYRDAVRILAPGEVVEEISEPLPFARFTPGEQLEYSDEELEYIDGED
jgi:hypothetical protein